MTPREVVDRFAIDKGAVVRYMGPHGMMAGYFIRALPIADKVELFVPELQRNKIIETSNVLAVRPRTTENDLEV